MICDGVASACSQDARVTSYLAGSGEEGESLRGRLGVLLDQVSLGLQRWRDPPLTPPSADSAASLSVAEVSQPHYCASAVLNMLAMTVSKPKLCMVGVGLC